MPKYLLSGLLLSLLLAIPAIVVAKAPGEGAVAGAPIQVERFEIPSPNFGSPVPVVALVPVGGAPPGGWPLVVLLHGFGGSENDWTALGSADKAYASLLAAKVVRPAVVVMPGMGNNWYVDSAQPNGIKAESALMDDVLPFVRQKFGVSRDARDVSIIGNSMGGYGALRFALKYPDVFGCVAALSPAIWQNVPADQLGLPPDQINLLIESSYFHTGVDGSITEGIVLPNPGPHFNSAFGEPFDPRRFNALNPLTLLEKRIADGAPLPQIYVSVGSDDSHLLWRGAFSLFATMKAGNRPMSFHVTSGDHTWDVWREALPDALKFAIPFRQPS